MDFRIGEGVQSIDASCGIHIDQFSGRTEPAGSIREEAHALHLFVYAFGFLTLPPSKLMIACECYMSVRSGSRTSGILGIKNPAGESFIWFPSAIFFVFKDLYRFDPNPFCAANLQ